MPDQIAAPAAPAGNTPSTESTAAPAAPVTPAPSAAPADATTAAAAAATVPAAAPPAPEAPQAPAAKAPDKYDFKSADGKVDPTVLTKFEGLARELDLTQEQAAKLIDQLHPEASKAQQTQLEAARTGWMEASKVDKEFGGDKLQENMAIAKKALESFGSPELTKLLNESGLGNHPEIIRAFYRAGKQITSGNFVPSGQGASAAKDPGSKLYPSMK